MKIPESTPDPFKQVQEYGPGQIQEIFKSEVYYNLARRFETEYWHWDSFKYRVPKGMNAALAWALLKIGRAQRYRFLPLAGRDRHTLKFSVPDIVQKELMLIDQQLAGHLFSDSEQPLNSTQRERFIVSSLREEAIASSMLEGAVTTRQEAKQMLKSGRKPRTHGEQMVVNNYRAIMFIREHCKEDLTPAFLLELQRILTHDTLPKPDQVGRFRTADDPVDIVDERDQEVVHVPPHASELEERLDNLCRFANGQTPTDSFVHPVIQACILHFQLGFDHPFCDGNGRTGRALFYWLMLRHGYWLFEYLPISRLIFRSPAQYARAFLYTETDEFDVTYFLLYKMKIIARARKDLHDYLDAKRSEMAQARKLFTSDRRLNRRQREAVLYFTNNPDAVLTISEYMATVATSYGTARSDLLSLAAWGYLQCNMIGKQFEFTAGEKLIKLETGAA